jgi:Domain of unknown function (DUF222)
MSILLWCLLSNRIEHMRRGVDYAALAPEDRLNLLTALQQWRCEMDAMQNELLASIAAEDLPTIDRSRDPDKQWSREDVACALRVPCTSAGHLLESAHELKARFPDTLHALWEGEVTARMADQLVDATVDLPDATAREVERRVLTRAGTQTFAQFAQSVRRAVAIADPRGAEQKHAAEREQRRVVITALEHGMSELFAVLPADQAAEIRAAVDTIADRWAGLDERTADQRRADALHHLAEHWADNDALADPHQIDGADTDGACAGRPARLRGARTVVNVTVPLSVLLGLDERCSELDDHGPIPATVARRLAFGPHTVWRRLLVDDTDGSGRILDVSARTYRPPAAMSRYVRLRDRTCRFPGCQRRAAGCELDHVRPWLRSRDTSPGNLICLCPRHHHLKHEAGWTLRRDNDHAVHWTNPSGRTYSRLPPEPPPF